MGQGPPFGCRKIFVANYGRNSQRLEKHKESATLLLFLWVKKDILQSRYNAIRIANQEQLKLYFDIGRYNSENSRSGYWGTGAVEFISERLRADLPGLVGFSLTSMKNMRKFYEAWVLIENKSATTVADFRWLPSERRSWHRTWP